MIAALEAAGIKPSCSGPKRPRTAPSRPTKTRKIAPLSSSSTRRDRRHHRHPAQFRRRARHRRHPASRRPPSARAHPGHARPRRQHDHRLPPRQLLRQDVGLQQPHAVRHPLLAHHAAHRSARLARVQATSPGSPPSAASSAACATSASAPSARAPPPSTPSATRKSSSKHTGISVETLDLSEILGRIARMNDNDDAAQAKLAAIKKYVSTRHPRCRADEDGQARRRHRRLDDGQRAHHQRRPVLDIARRVLRRRPLHRHEHDERKPHLQRLRGRHPRHAQHARAHPRLRDPQRAARLEQQLRRRSRQGRLLPLLQPAQAFLQRRREDGLPADHRRHRRQREHLRHLRRHE